MSSNSLMRCRRQDWAATKLAGHFAATASRFKASEGPVLLLQDTTEFIYQRAAPEKIGFTKSVNSGRSRKGRLRHHTLCGILMHTSLACTAAGLPLGLTALKVWTRASFKGTAALKRKINPTRVPIGQKEACRPPRRGGNAHGKTGRFGKRGRLAGQFRAVVLRWSKPDLTSR